VLEGRFAGLHDPELQLERERRLVPGLPTVVPFVRPLFYAVALAPIAMLPYQTAFVVWIVLQVSLLFGCWYWAYRRFGPMALMVAAFYQPAPLGIATGQDCVELLVILIFAYELMRLERPMAAGAVLALMLLKFHLVLLWPFVLLMQRRWRMLAGYCVAAVVEVLVCLGLGGVRGAETYIALLQNKNLDRLSPSPELMISHEGLAANLGVDGGWVAAVVVLVVVGTILARIRNAPLWQTFALTSFGSLVIVPHVYVYDATLLMLPIWLLVFESGMPMMRLAARIYSTPLPFCMALGGKPFSIGSSIATLGVFLIVGWEDKKE